MPLVKIDLRKGKSADDRRAIGDIFYDALLEALATHPGYLGT